MFTCISKAYIFEVVKQATICPVHLMSSGSVAHNNSYGVELILDSIKYIQPWYWDILQAIFQFQNPRCWYNLIPPYKSNTCGWYIFFDYEKQIIMLFLENCVMFDVQQW